MKDRIQTVGLLTITLLLLAGSEALGQKTSPTPPDPRVLPTTTTPTTSPTPVRPSMGSTRTVVTDTVGRPVAVPITSLRVRIVTSDLSSSGTDSDVFFDIGPIGWKLDKEGYNDFESGDDDTYILPLPEARLTTDDILWMRLQIGGNDTWKPQTVELLVNGSVYSHADVRGLELNESHPYWVASVPRASGYSREEQFIRSLSVVGYSFSSTRVLSTPPWVQDLPGICATGIVTYAHDVTDPVDGYIPVILRLESVWFSGRELLTPSSQNYTLDAAHGISNPRYLSVRYTVQTDHRLNPDQRVRICGSVRWISGDGFTGGDYALIPHTQADTTFPR